MIQVKMESSTHVVLKRNFEHRYEVLLAEKMYDSAIREIDTLPPAHFELWRKSIG